MKVRNLEYRLSIFDEPNDPKAIELREEIESAKKKVPRAAQIKEKFGTLRFYTDKKASEYQRGVIDAIESLSGRVCEICGSPGTIRNNRYIRTLCDTHFTPDKKED